MKKAFLLLGLVLRTTGAVSGAETYPLADLTVAVREDAPAMVKLAAEEIRTYVYRLTGRFPSLLHDAGSAGPRPLLVVETSSGEGDNQDFRLTVESGRQIVQGDSPRATLWAAYELIEHWGVGFYLSGDAVPPEDVERQVPYVNVEKSPALRVRGNLPWFNFLNSPTTWNPQDYKTFFAQMAKQKANFIGFHSYDHEPFGAYDITDASAKMGGPLMTTISEHRWWSPHIMTTKDFLFGTGQFFERGEWGCEVGIEAAWSFAPGRTTRWQQEMVADALTYAKKLGISTCLGWEVSGDADDPGNREVFRKRLAHTLKTYPLDYFWIWQAEGRGTAGETNISPAGEPNKGIAVSDEVRKAFAYLGPDHDLMEAARITRYVNLAHETLKELAPRVRLIVSGWGGDEHMKFSTLYVGLDKVVPDDVIFAALDNIDPRLEPNVSAAYGQCKPARERWPIPWFESDAGHTRVDQTGPQTNVTAFEPLLKDIVAKGCQGALGIHWRTRNVEDVAGYLYRFGWEPNLTAAEYFNRYAHDRYGPDQAEKMAQVHLRLEEFGPQYVGAVGTVECASNRFWWFWQGWKKRILKDAPNLADADPNPERFPELEAISRDAKQAALRACGIEAHDAAIAYHDLAHTIDWLVKRTRVGIAIWGETSPLEQRLRQATRLWDEGKRVEAGKMAGEILDQLEALDFRGACQSLASTCRTRGELGMLATANARYGRYYATFVERVCRILGQPTAKFLEHEKWTGNEVLTVYPVPNWVDSGETVLFDAVLLPAVKDVEFEVVLNRLDEDGESPVHLSLERLGGAYHRAIFAPSTPGVWNWRLMPKSLYRRPANSIPFADGVVMAR